MIAAGARPLAGNPPDAEAAFAAAPAEVVAEILDGVFYAQARPGRRHTRGASRLGILLGGPFDLGLGGPGGWVILDEPELHLGPAPDKIVPDLAGWRRERMPDALGDDDAPHFYDLAPDWVGEVISASTERVDRGKKLRIYRREGVHHVWFLSPDAKVLEVYRLAADGAHYLLLDMYEGEERPRVEPFDAIELELTSLWAR